MTISFQMKSHSDFIFMESGANSDECNMTDALMLPNRQSL